MVAAEKVELLDDRAADDDDDVTELIEDPAEAMAARRLATTPRTPAAAAAAAAFDWVEPPEPRFGSGGFGNGRRSLSRLEATTAAVPSLLIIAACSLVIFSSKW